MKKLISFLLLFVLLVACSNADEETEVKVLTPYDYLREYIALWEQNNFSTMYDEYILDRIKAKYGYEDFVERYEHLYNVLEVSNLSIEIVEEEDIDEEELKYLTEYEIPINISFDTIAGPINYQNNVKLYKNELDDFSVEDDEVFEENWLIEWDHSLILPRLADGDHVRLRTLPASRGEIVDRNGKLLATNGEVYEIGVTLQHFNEASLPKLAEVLNVSEDFIRSKYQQSWVQEHHFVPIKKLLLEEEKTVTQAVSIEGVTSRIVIERIYPYKNIAAHLTGYIGAISQEELEELEKFGYTASDRVGKRGLEQLYEQQLKGEDGVELYIEKADHSTSTITRKEPRDGETIKLTIDIDIQEKLYQIVKEDRGTAITINPTTGEVTSLLSFPTFDPNKFILGITNEEYNEFIEDEGKPNINRFAATYSPGSTMKLISASIGLNTGNLDPYEIVNINGKRWKKDESWGDYHITRVYDQYNEVDLKRAISHSDNIYFAMLALNIGSQLFKDELNRLGFSESIPFDYPIIRSQISNNGEFNSEVLLVDTSYGQGELLINIIHLTSLYGGIVNDGHVMKPLLTTEEQQSVWIEMIDAEDAQLLQQYLRSVVSEGTARTIDLPDKRMAGKTGTAELKSSYEDEEGIQNGIFVTYDQNNPDVVLGIIIEGVHELGGSGYVVDLAKKFFE